MAVKKHAGRAAPITCYWYGQVVHIARNCQTSSEKEFGQSNAVRHPHRQHKRKRRAVRSGGSGGPSGDGGSQSSQKQQQQQQQRQRRQHGTRSASGGAVGAVPQQAVQVEPTATVPGTEPASVEASATTPAAETGATPAAAPAGVPLDWAPFSTPPDESRPIRAGGVLYLSPVPDTTEEAPTPAPHALPCRRVGIATNQSAEDVPAKYQGQHVPAGLSLPNQRERGVISVYVVLLAGPHLTNLSVKIVEMLERLCPGMPLRTPCPLGARHAVNATGSL